MAAKLTLKRVAAQFEGSLSPALDISRALWGVATAKRLQKILATGNLPEGGRLAKNHKKTIRKKGFNQPGVEKGDLRRSILLKENVTVKGEHGMEVGAAGFAHRWKAKLLIEGKSAKKSYRDALGKRHRRVNKQPPRDYVAIDPKTVEEIGEKVLQEVLKTWRWKLG